MYKLDLMSNGVVKSEWVSPADLMYVTHIWWEKHNGHKDGDAYERENDTIFFFCCSSNWVDVERPIPSP